MPSINIGYLDFDAVAAAAVAAQSRGEVTQAQQLDKLARKINAALANASAPRRQAGLAGSAIRLTWRDAPSVLSP